MENEKLRIENKTAGQQDCETARLYKMKNEKWRINNYFKRKNYSLFIINYKFKHAVAFTLAEGATHVKTCNNNRKAAFTLAEVLITLGIIGVVAALTIPTLVAKYQEQATVTRLKKTVSILNQAYWRVIEEYGTPDTWGLTNTYVNTDDEGNVNLDNSSKLLLTKRLTNYLKVVKYFKKGENLGDTYWLSGDYAQGVAGVVDYDDTYFALNDGTIVSLGWISNCINPNNACSDAWVIFPKKNGHKIGRDVFNLILIPNKGFLPYYAQYADLQKGNLQYCEKTSNLSRGCTAWVLYIGNMDYLHCNDLNWETKTKCK